MDSGRFTCEVVDDTVIFFRERLSQAPLKRLEYTPIRVPKEASAPSSFWAATRKRCSLSRRRYLVSSRKNTVGMMQRYKPFMKVNNFWYYPVVESSHVFSASLLISGIVESGCSEFDALMGLFQSEGCLRLSPCSTMYRNHQKPSLLMPTTHEEEPFLVGSISRRASCRE